METINLRTTFAQLQVGYRRRNDDMIVGCINELIDYLKVDIDKYPDKVRIALEGGINKFKDFQTRVLTDMVDDYDSEWDACQKLIDQITHGVFIPWLNEGGQQDFRWVSGGDS